MELAAIGGVGTSLVLVAATSEGEVSVKSGQIKTVALLGQYCHEQSNGGQT